MTWALNDDEHHGLSVRAGGREVWHHDPDRCQIEGVMINSGSIMVKCSAGGYDRGIAMEVYISIDFILMNLLETLKGKEDRLEIVGAKEVQIASTMMKAIAETWSAVGIDALPLGTKKKNYWRTLESLL